MYYPLVIEEYNRLSFVVRDPTSSYSDYLKNMGGRWNTNLVGGPGWLFNRKRHGNVVEFVICVNMQQKCQYRFFMGLYASGLIIGACFFCYHYF